MDQLRTPTISQIKEVPGLFISDRFAASSISNIESHNIVRILSLVQPSEVPRFGAAQHSGNEEASAESKKDVEIKNINIDDDPTVDILEHLQDSCDWIQDGLDFSLSGDPEPRQAGVLVHCRQGISRSGAFIVAFLMRKLQIPYPAALSMAQESRSLICPNKGFERQLQVWGDCKYDVYVDNPATSAAAENLRKEKQVYRAWKRERDNLAKGGAEALNKARFSAMASMAAKFGQRRQEAAEGSKDETGS